MTDTERILYFQSLERGCAEAEGEMERLKDLHAKAKKVYESRIEELRSAVRRDDDQIDIPFSDHQVIGEDRQIPENKTSDVPDGVLFENPIDGLPAAEEPANVLTLPERNDDQDHDDGR